MKHCKVDVLGALLVVTIDRPHAMNALPPEGSAELARIFDAFAADPVQRVAILTGAGDRSFCAGADLKNHAEGRAVALPSSGFGGLTARTGMHKPVIAAVNGAAVGGGFELVLACDLVVAAAHAWFSLPEVRVGQVARGGGLIRLPRQLPPKTALYMALTGRRMPADEAHRLGLVNEVVPDGGDVLAVARALASRVLEGAPQAVEATKNIASLSINGADTEALLHAQEELPSVKAWRASGERLEGARSFLEKRPPHWV
ncbi:MAG: enoyl-CoA hydratase-related protein [Ottowia sp.]|uniref:enoyl-CoA hydratase-related protein n=1 Tax=Ottowia sp. TaxID=1898956 RepID=UPI003C75BD7B